jgi:hypothetical protein
MEFDPGNVGVQPNAIYFLRPVGHVRQAKR